MKLLHRRIIAIVLMLLTAILPLSATEIKAYENITPHNQLEPEFPFFTHSGTLHWHDFLFEVFNPISLQGLLVGGSENYQSNLPLFRDRIQENPFVTHYLARHVVGGNMRVHHIFQVGSESRPTYPGLLGRPFTAPLIIVPDTSGTVVAHIQWNVDGSFGDVRVGDLWHSLMLSGNVMVNRYYIEFDDDPGSDVNPSRISKEEFFRIVNSAFERYYDRRSPWHDHPWDPILPDPNFTATRNRINAGYRYVFHVRSFQQQPWPPWNGGPVHITRQDHFMMTDRESSTFWTLPEHLKNHHILDWDFTSSLEGILTIQFSADQWGTISDGTPEINEWATSNWELGENASPVSLPIFGQVEIIGKYIILRYSDPGNGNGSGCPYSEGCCTCPYPPTVNNFFEENHFHEHFITENHFHEHIENHYHEHHHHEHIENHYHENFITEEHFHEHHTHNITKYIENHYHFHGNGYGGLNDYMLLRIRQAIEELRVDVLDAMDDHTNTLADTVTDSIDGLGTRLIEAMLDMLLEILEFFEYWFEGFGVLLFLIFTLTNIAFVIWIVVMIWKAIYVAVVQAWFWA